MIKKGITAALALAAILPSVPTVSVQQQSSITVNAKQKEGIVKPVRTARQFVREDAGGLQVISHNPGIPPHIYGAHYVRPRSHKRSNV
jgi:hypothetical protein